MAFFEAPEGKVYLEHAEFVEAAAERMDFLFVHADPEPSIQVGKLAVGLITLAVNGLPPGWIEKKILAELRELLGRPAQVDELVAALRRHLVHPLPGWAVQMLAAVLGEQENGCEDPDRAPQLWPTIVHSISSPPPQ
jgi:hypothetical protein